MDEQEDDFFDAADDMPAPLRIVYIGLSVLCGAAALATLPILFSMGH